MKSKTQPLEKMTDRELLEQIYRRTLRTHQHIRFQNTLTGIKILVVAIPLIVGLLYLPEFLRKSVPQYQKLMESYRQSTQLMEGINDLK